MGEFRVTMPVRDWCLIDAMVDNAVSIAAVGGDEDAVATGSFVREAGWAAAASHPDVDEGVNGWPPTGADLVVALPSAHWTFVLAQLSRWADVNDSVGQFAERDELLRVQRALLST